VPQQPPGALDPDQHCADAAITWNAKRRQLCVCPRELGAGTDPHDQAAFGNPVERGDDMRQRDRVP